MKRLAASATLAGLAALLSAPALAETIFEVEHARTTARVGGPVSSLEADLLERYGVHSGTPADWRNRVRGTFEFYPHERSQRGKVRRYRD